MTGWKWESAAAADPTGESFCFERGAARLDGANGWADVWKRGCFAFEYKGKKMDSHGRAIWIGAPQLKVTFVDDGTPPLTSYRRVIFEIRPAPPPEPKP